MQIVLRVRLDLGDGDVAEQLRDADSALLAVLDALAWRGQITLVGPHALGASACFAYIDVEASRHEVKVPHFGRLVEPAGVEWGGR